MTPAMLSVMGLEEPILVVPRDRLLPPEGVQGFVAGPTEGYEESIRRHGAFRLRGAVEDDPSLKQIIPYLIVRQGGRVFLFQRLHRGAEERLRGLYSIGIGGHIGREDTRAQPSESGDPLRAGLTRELEEELVLRGTWAARAVGVLNDDLSPVGRVHFGIVYVIDVDQPSLRVREVDRLRGHLASPREVQGARPRMETWSQLVLDAADPFTL